MKHLLKFSYLIIFAAIVASVSTSCSNDSELFEEPVMYQTRAMTRVGMRGEDNNINIDIYNRIIKDGGSQNVTKDVILNKMTATVTFHWSGGNSIGSTKLFSQCKVESTDKNCWASDTIIIGTALFNGAVPTATYTFTVYQRVYNGYYERYDTLNSNWTDSFEGKAVELKDPDYPYSINQSDLIHNDSLNIQNQ